MSPTARGTALNPPNKFEEIAVERDPDAPDDPLPKTRFFNDAARDVLSYPKGGIPYRYGLNPYRGCEHGCIYCYAREYHEYLGFSTGLDFETKIMVKRDAAALLGKRLASKRWEPDTVWLSGATDPYQPVERRLHIVRDCLAVLRDFRNPVAVITKNALVERDADLLGELASHHAAAVNVSVTTLDRKLHRRMEPRTSTPENRLAAIRTLSEARVPVSVFIAPVVCGLNDHEIPAIIERAAEAGARWAMMMPVRLSDRVRPLFEAWLSEHYPARREKVLRQIEEAGSDGPLARGLKSLFRLARKKAGMAPGGPELSAASFRRAAPGQGELFR